MKVYLAGPITGQSYDNANDWRQEASRKLSGAGVVSYSPMRAKELLAARKELSAWDYESGNGPLASRTMVRRDLADVRAADVVLLYLLEADRVSLGSMCELGYAHALGKYVVTVMEPRNVHRHIFVHELSSVIFSTLDEAVTWINEVMNV